MLLQVIGGPVLRTCRIRGDAASAAETQHWMAVAGKLVLSPAQRQSLLDIRHRQRARLAELEHLRKDLCMLVRMPYRQT